MNVSEETWFYSAPIFSTGRYHDNVEKETYSVSGPFRLSSIGFRFNHVIDNILRRDDLG